MNVCSCRALKSSRAFGYVGIWRFVIENVSLIVISDSNVSGFVLVRSRVLLTFMRGMLDFAGARVDISKLNNFNYFFDEK